ncbi:hypothetical protein [Pleomorphochaeta sp. DL1XJH-081]|uniref:hypothetical protein n=1 Tax=Pleomorphochaeta sp. DL1XJH-081 TaxID=3409690 RepID=UPI003BB5C262
MLIEKTRAAFDPIVLPLTNVGANSTQNGVEIDFDAKNQMVETNEVLEVYLTEKATSAGSPTLQVIVETKNPEGVYRQVASGEVVPLSALVEGAVVYKVALPDGCDQIVRVSLKNDTADTFTGGSVSGFVRPL